MRYLAPLKDISASVMNFGPQSQEVREDALLKEVMRLNAAMRAVERLYPFLDLETVRNSVEARLESDPVAMVKQVNKAVIAGLVDRIITHYGATTDREALARAIKRSHRPSFFVNSLHPDGAAALASLSAESYGIGRCDWFPGTMIVESSRNISKPERTRLHDQGIIYVKRLASLLPPALLGLEHNSEATVLDICAAPGGKSVQLACLMGGHGTLIACDSSRKRFDRLIKTLDRCNVSAGCRNLCLFNCEAQAVSEEPSVRGRCDYVLADVPCSSSGLLRHDPSRLQLLNVLDLQDFVCAQAAIFDAAFTAAKRGGRICYSTCSLTFEENELQVEQFKRKYSGSLAVLDPREVVGLNTGPWSLTPAIEASRAVQLSLGISDTSPTVRIWPHQYNTEGFFCALFERK